MTGALRALALAALGTSTTWCAAQSSSPVVRSADGSLAIESCVSPDRIVLAATDRRAMLDEPERAAVHAQLMQRYPAAQRDGVVPSHIVLWQQPTGAWVYVSLLQHPAHPAQWCFTASFVAGGIEATASLLRKYFSLRAA